MYSSVLNKTSSFLFYLEQRRGVYFTSLVVAVILLGFAAIYVTPALAPMQLGRGYASLSINPFDFSEQNNLRFRILTPLLAYLVGLRGSLYLIFPMIIALFFLSAIYYFLRQKHNSFESVLITMLVCFSSPILFLLHFQGYVDVTSYLLIYLIIIFIKNNAIRTLLLVLLLFNHESNLFIIPGLLFLYYINSTNRIKAIAYGGMSILLAIIPFYYYRKFITGISPVEYNFDMYYSQISQNINSITSHIGIGCFYSFKLFWLIPLIAIYYYWKEKNWQQLILFFLIIFGSLGQLIIASDTSRLMGLAFPAILFGAVKLKEQWGKEVFLRRTFYLILFNFLIPQFYVGQSVMIPFYPLPVSIILKYFYGIETWVG